MRMRPLSPTNGATHSTSPWYRATRPLTTPTRNTLSPCKNNEIDSDNYHIPQFRWHHKVANLASCPKFPRCQKMFWPFYHFKFSGEKSLKPRNYCTYVRTQAGQVGKPMFSWGPRPQRRNTMETKETDTFRQKKYILYIHQSSGNYPRKPMETKETDTFPTHIPKMLVRRNLPSKG